MFLSIREQSALKRKFGIKREQIKGGWTKLRNVLAHSFPIQQTRLY